MQNKINDTLLEVVEEMFEELAFVFVMPEDCDFDMDDSFLDEGGPDAETNEPEPDKEVVASIAFTGPFGGMLFLSVSEDLLPTLAANMLGLDDDVPPSHEDREDAYRELLNVILGNLLPRIAGTDAVFDVKRAEILPSGTIPATFQGKPPQGDIRFTLEIGQATLVFFSEQDISNAGELAQVPLEHCSSAEE